MKHFKCLHSKYFILQGKYIELNIGFVLQRKIIILNAREIIFVYLISRKTFRKGNMKYFEYLVDKIFCGGINNLGPLSLLSFWEKPL